MTYTYDKKKIGKELTKYKRRAKRFAKGIKVRFFDTGDWKELKKVKVYTIIFFCAKCGKKQERKVIRVNHCPIKIRRVCFECKVKNQKIINQRNKKAPIS